MSVGISRAGGLQLSKRRFMQGDLLPVMPSFMERICSGFAPLWGGLQTRLA
jgi:hypothetical protein